MKHPWAWPLALVAGALCLRLLLFTGLQGSDDRLYSASAWHLSRGEPSPGPDLFRTRIAYVGPVAAWYRLFGVSVAGLILPSLAASLALVLLAYRLGQALYSEPVARAAGVFAALVPLDVFYATTSSTDLPLAAFLGLGTWLLCRPEPEDGRRRWARAIGAGLAFGAAHLTKESALLLAIPALVVLRTRAKRSTLLVGGAVTAGVILLEILFYAVLEGDPLHRIHVARSTLTSTPETSSGFLGRLLALPSFCLNPSDPAFVFGGGLMAVSLAATIWLLVRDRERAGAIALWWLCTGLVLTLFPASLLPYRAALPLQGRMFAVLVLPGALIAAVFVVEIAGARSPRATAVAAAVPMLVALVCSYRLYDDARLWRAGAEWAHRKLESTGADVVTDPRTAELLRMMSRYAPINAITAYRADLPPPKPGTLLLRVPRQAAASAYWDQVEAPPWWNGSVPRRHIVANAKFPAPWRVRGPRGEGEAVFLVEVD